MLKTEVAELQSNGKMYEVSEKLAYKLDLSQEDKEIVDMGDAYFRELIRKGDPEKEISAYITRVINEEVYNAPDELLDMIFNRGTIAELDDGEYTKMPKNSLVAYEAAHGGTVDRSWIDIDVLKPTRRNLSVATDLSYVDVRRNGFKSVATLTTYATEALQNAMFADVFNMVDVAITGGPQEILESTAAPTQASMDALSLYLLDRMETGAVAVTQNKYAQAIGRMSGHAQYMSEQMKNNFNRYGLVDFFNGISIAHISGAKKMGNGLPIFPDKKVFGIADKIGSLDMRGNVEVYEDMNNQDEIIVLNIKKFSYDFTIIDATKVAKITIQG